MVDRGEYWRILLNDGECWWEMVNNGESSWIMVKCRRVMVNNDEYIVVNHGEQWWKMVDSGDSGESCFCQGLARLSSVMEDSPGDEKEHTVETKWPLWVIARTTGKRTRQTIETKWPLFLQKEQAVETKPRVWGFLRGQRILFMYVLCTTGGHAERLNSRSPWLLQSNYHSPKGP